MTRCFKLIKDLPYIPAGSYFKMDFSGRNIYLSISTQEFFMKRRSHPFFQFYTFPWDQELLGNWFEETENVPDQGDASTYFHGKNWYWTKPKWHCENGEYVYCDRKTIPIKREEVPIKGDFSEEDKEVYRIDVIEDYPVGHYDIYLVDKTLYIVGNTIAGDKYFKVL